MPPCWLIFIFLAEMGFPHFGQAGLKLLTSGDPPTLASQSAEMTGVSHCAPPRVDLLSMPAQPGLIREILLTALGKGEEKCIPEDIYLS